jgi:hypothetical protein
MVRGDLVYAATQLRRCVVTLPGDAIRNARPQEAEYRTACHPGHGLNAGYDINVCKYAADAGRAGARREAAAGLPGSTDRESAVPRRLAKMEHGEEIASETLGRRPVAGATRAAPPALRESLGPRSRECRPSGWSPPASAPAPKRALAGTARRETARHCDRFGHARGWRP